MLTRNGWLTGAGALLLLVVGRLTGSFELFLLGSGVAVLLLVAVLRTALARLDLRVSRHVEPPRVHAGSPARVELRLRNDGSRSTPVLRLRDAVTGTRGATVLVSPLPSGGSGRAAYLLPTGRRGMLQVGPLDVIVGDAFGLTAAEVEGAGVTELIVYPRIDPIVALPAASGHDPQATARHPNAIGRAGDDFYALRPYQVGDDLRRVHWPATAHHDELMIRQHELPWQERTTVVLDVRARAHVTESFELAVSAAASILNACANRGDQVRLITTAGSDSGFEGGRHHLEACFLHLARVAPDQSASLQRSLDLLGRGTSGGSLVLVVAALASTDLRRLSNLRSRFGKVVTVLIEPSSWDPDGIDQAAPPDVSNLVQVARDQPFLESWNRHFGPSRRGGGPTTRAAVGSGASARRRFSLQLPTELALVGVSLATLAGFRRLFLDWSFLGKPLLLVLLSHLLAGLLRRRRTPVALAALISAVVLVVAGSWLFYFSTTRLGLPGSATLDAFTADLRAAFFDLFRDVEAPAEALPGFVAGTAIALWITAFLADWAAFRLWAPFEAVLPSAGLFVFASLFGADQYRAGAAAVFLASVLAFLLLHRAWRLESSAAWIRGDAQRGSRALVRAGVGLAAAALVIGAATGPLLPGAHADAVLDWKDLGGGDGTRVTLSPLVDLQSRLVQDSETEVFTARSDRRAYWRLTALDAFDGRVWKSSRRFSRVSGELPAQTTTHAATTLVQQRFDISGLSQIWLPAAFEPREIDAPGLLTRWESTTSTLIVDRQTSDGLQYDVTSAYPNYVASELRQATGPPPDEIAQQFLELPADFSPKVANLAEQVTSQAATPFDEALALQSYFRTNFTYSIAVNSGHGDNRLESFLFEEQQGYCEQFAGAFAAMARSIGLPARVAVGFTPGDLDAADPTLYHVKGKHAHAWPEVYLTGYGWVLFEPTPSRGAPNAGYTGVSEEQDPSSPIPTLTGDVTTTTAPALSVDPTNPDLAEPLPGGDGAPVEPLTDATSPGDGGGGGWAGWLLFLLLGVAALYVVAMLGGHAARRLLRRRRANTARARIDVAWREAVESLGVLGIEPSPAETPLELASRAGRQVRMTGPELGDLARLTTGARYAEDRPVDEADAEVAFARRGAAAVADQVRATTSAPQRLGYHLSPRARLNRARHHRGPRRSLGEQSTAHPR